MIHQTERNEPTWTFAVSSLLVRESRLGMDSRLKKEKKHQRVSIRWQSEVLSLLGHGTVNAVFRSFSSLLEG